MQADDGESYLTHEMKGASRDGRLPQLSFTTNIEHAKAFQAFKVKPIDDLAEAIAGAHYHKNNTAPNI